MTHNDLLPHNLVLPKSPPSASWSSYDGDDGSDHQQQQQLPWVCSEHAAGGRGVQWRLIDFGYAEGMSSNASLSSSSAESMPTSSSSRNDLQQQTAEEESNLLSLRRRYRHHTPLTARHRPGGGFPEYLCLSGGLDGRPPDWVEQGRDDVYSLGQVRCQSISQLSGAEMTTHTTV